MSVVVAAALLYTVIVGVPVELVVPSYCFVSVTAVTVMARAELLVRQGRPGQARAQYEAALAAYLKTAESSQGAAKVAATKSAAAAALLAAWLNWKSSGSCAGRAAA